MGRILEPVYIMIKKKTPVEKARDRLGLSSRIMLMSVTTRSTRMGSKVKRSCTMCGSVFASERNLLARGNGLTTAPSGSLHAGGGGEGEVLTSAYTCF